MPLHLLGKKSWNVYNPANIARVKADEAAAAAREAADEQRMQEVDAARRAAILRGKTPPPLPEEDTGKGEKRRERRDGHDRKRRKLAGEDDTDMDIRLAASVTAPRDEKDEDARVVRLRKPDSDAPLTDHAGNINLFPIDPKEVVKREKNEEAEKEKKRKERSFEDQYTMRFSNAAGRDGLEQPWYATGPRKAAERESEAGAGVIDYPGFQNKNIWGNDDPLRKEREQARITSNDPFAFMQKAQAQLKKSKDDKRRWTEERARDLRELKATQERDARRQRHGRKRSEDEYEYENAARDASRGSERIRSDPDRASKRKHSHRSRVRSRERRYEHGPDHHKRRRRRSRSGERHDRRID